MEAHRPSPGAPGPMVVATLTTAIARMASTNTCICLRWPTRTTTLERSWRVSSVMLFRFRAMHVADRHRYPVLCGGEQQIHASLGVGSLRMWCVRIDVGRKLRPLSGWSRTLNLRVWWQLTIFQDAFSNHPNIKRILQSAKSGQEEHNEFLDLCYDDGRLSELTNGVDGKH